MSVGKKHILDVLIVGGGPAGLSCALSLVRGGRKIIICDDNRPRNKTAKTIRNIPGHEGISPHDYRELLKKSLCSYHEQVTFKEIQVSSIKKENKYFVSTLNNQEIIRTKRVVIAEGVEDILPDIKGVKELWGKFVFHCPYCHGYEQVGKEFGVIANNKKAIQMIRLLKGLTDDINIFTNDYNIFNECELEEFRSKDIKVFVGEIISLHIENDKLLGINLKNNERVKCSSLFIQNEVKPKSQLGTELGCHLAEGGIYEVDENGLSSVEGVYFAGDVSSHAHSVIMASALGSHVGICVNADLLRNMFRHANC